MCGLGCVEFETQNSRGRTGRWLGREGNSGAGDVELLGLSEDGGSGGIDLYDVDLESGTGGPTGSRTIDGGGTISGGNVLLENGIVRRVYILQGRERYPEWDGIKTDIVSQGECKAGRVGGDGSPSHSLTLGCSIPDGTLGRLNDCGRQGIDDEKGESGEDGEGTHRLDWKMEE